MQIETITGTTAALVHDGYHYALDLTTLAHPATATGPDALTWASPTLVSTDGGPDLTAVWPLGGGPEAQRLAVHALVALGAAADLPGAVQALTATLAAAKLALRLDLAHL